MLRAVGAGVDEDGGPVTPSKKARTTAPPVPQAMVVVPKGTELMGDTAKDLPAQIMMRFIATVQGGEVLEGRTCLVYLGPAREGDLRWSIDNVFNKVDIFCTQTVSKAPAVAEMLRTAYERAGGTPELCGLSLLRWELGRLNAPFDEMRR